MQSTLLVVAFCHSISFSSFSSSTISLDFTHIHSLHRFDKSAFFSSHLLTSQFGNAFLFHMMNTVRIGETISHIYLCTCVCIECKQTEIDVKNFDGEIIDESCVEIFGVSFRCCCCCCCCFVAVSHCISCCLSRFFLFQWRAICFAPVKILNRNTFCS